ncbi:hypothetical protein GMA40_10395 [Turicibacter sanguinis]|nr:hypothetical protein [Turicibacter sanguinis]
MKIILGVIVVGALIASYVGVPITAWITRSIHRIILIKKTPTVIVTVGVFCLSFTII